MDWRWPDMRRAFLLWLVFLTVKSVALASLVSGQDSLTNKFSAKYCAECHSHEDPQAGLEIPTESQSLTNQHVFDRWVRIHDRLESAEMPPEDADQPTNQERQAVIKELKQKIANAEVAAEKTRPQLRRLTRTEYENVIRDLFDMPGIALAGNLPEDGSSHGFDKHPEALDLSHVNIQKYLESADHILNYAIATRPQPPTIHKRRISLVNRGGFVAHIVMNGDGILLKDQLPDPDFPPAAEQNHFDQGAHERWGSFRNGASVGLFRHEDESVSPYFIEHVTIYPARYRVRTSLWSFQWDQGKMLPGRGTESARLSVVQLTGDGRGGQHPSYALGYFDAPKSEPMEHELTVWLNHNELIGFNTASLAPAANYYKKRRAMEFTGPGIAVDWLDIEGPLYSSWPPTSHRLLFSDLPIKEFDQANNQGIRPPFRSRPRQIGAGMNRPDNVPGTWTVQSPNPETDAKRLLSAFLPKLFRRPVPETIVNQYVELVRQRLKAGDCFELAMRAAFRNALVAPDFLFHVEKNDLQNRLDDYSLANRLSFFFWNSIPDDELLQHVQKGDLRDPLVFHNQVERLLSHSRSTRFVNDFVGQWLRLYDIASTDPDKKLYPEFSPFLQDSMVAETRAYFRELIENDLDASHLVRSPFVTVNQKLATHYGIDDVTGTGIRRVPLPADCPRGGFLTQGSILKITANGTTTSPVQRGAFVVDRILGQPPQPPPPNVAAIEPDVRGTTTIREQLAKHRELETCASCHRKIDPPGIALESFDVLGGLRKRYRSIGEGDPAPRGSIDPQIGIGFKLGQPVDTTGKTDAGEKFKDIKEYQGLIAAKEILLLKNLIDRFAVYSTGRPIRFSDRESVNSIIRLAKTKGGGLRTLIHEFVASPLFHGGTKPIGRPANLKKQAFPTDTAQRMMMTGQVTNVPRPVIAQVGKKDPLLPKAAYKFKEEETIRVQLTGLFIPERVMDLERHLKEFPEVRLRDVSFDSAVAEFDFASDSDLFRGANPDQIIERINNRIRQLSNHTLGAKPLGTLTRDALKKITIHIVGLDCKACSFGVYEVLSRIDGVEQATASFRSGIAIAWIDPAKTDRAKIEEVLKKRGITLESK